MTDVIPVVTTDPNVTEAESKKELSDLGLQALKLRDFIIDNQIHPYEEADLKVIEGELAYDLSELETLGDSEEREAYRESALEILEAIIKKNENYRMDAYPNGAPNEYYDLDDKVRALAHTVEHIGKEEKKEAV